MMFLSSYRKLVWVGFKPTPLISVQIEYHSWLSNIIFVQYGIWIRSENELLTSSICCTKWMTNQASWLRFRFFLLITFAMLSLLLLLYLAKRISLYTYNIYIYIYISVCVHVYIRNVTELKCKDVKDILIHLI